jgi:guanylate kinase
MKIVIVGKAASGKDYLRKRMIQQGAKYGVSYTSRPPREGEIEGVDYYFTSKENFEKLITENKLIEYQQFNGWYYGMTYDTFNESDCMILNVDGLSQLPAEIRKQCFVIYVDIDMSIRKQRLSERNDNNDSITRRIEADEEQFKDFNNYDFRITNPDF